jgi:hypothetical protein
MIFSHLGARVAGTRCLALRPADDRSAAGVFRPTLASRMRLGGGRACVPPLEGGARARLRQEAWPASELVYFLCELNGGPPGAGAFSYAGSGSGLGGDPGGGKEPGGKWTVRSPWRSRCAASRKLSTKAA